MIIDFSQGAPAEGALTFPEWVGLADPRQPPVTEQIILTGDPSAGNTLYIGGAANQQPEL